MFNVLIPTKHLVKLVDNIINCDKI